MKKSDLLDLIDQKLQEMALGMSARLSAKIFFVDRRFQNLEAIGYPTPSRLVRLWKWFKDLRHVLCCSHCCEEGED